MNPLFASMPHKAELLQVLQGLAQMGGFRAELKILCLVEVDQGVDPAADCFALHVPRQYSMAGFGPPFFGPDYLSGIVGGFPIFQGPNLGFTGNFTPPLIRLSQID